MDTPESPVRHDKDLIAGLSLGNDRPDKPLQIALDARAIAERRERSCGIPAEVRAKAKNHVRVLETGGQAVFHQTGPHGAGSRLEHGQNARTSHLVSQT